jgi:hypothetical protein
MKIKVKNLRQNPFRNLERYPENRPKIETLKKSINTTGFWDNLLARPMPDTVDIYEIAYGHHRLIALRECGIEEIDIPVRPLGNEQMAKIMANENMEDWENSSLSEQETIRSIVEGFAAGNITLPFVKGGRVCRAPNFQPLENGNNAGPIYSVASLVNFLGWSESKIESVMQALATIEKGLVEENQFAGLTTYQAGVIAIQVQRVEREVKNPIWARTFGKELSSGMRSDRSRGSVNPIDRQDAQAVTTKSAKYIADQFIARQKNQDRINDRNAKKKLPPFDVFIGALTQYLYSQPGEALQKKLDAVLENREYAEKETLNELVAALDFLIRKLTASADTLRDVPNNTVKENQQRKLTHISSAH